MLRTNPLRIPEKEINGFYRYSYGTPMIVKNAISEDEGDQVDILE